MLMPERLSPLCAIRSSSRPLVATRMSVPPRSATPDDDAPLRRQGAERGWGFLAKPVRAPALRALVSQTLLRLK